MIEPRIYRYIVKTDRGTAPNPYDGFCTLAICKPAIRRKAQVGDWVIGFRSRQRGHVVYAMQVAERLSFDEYWRDKRFRSRRPSNKSIPADNFYRADGLSPDGSLVMKWVENSVHDSSAQSKDLSGHHVLVSTRFWYFGDASPHIDAELDVLAPTTQGHVVHKNRHPGDLTKLVIWLSSFRQGIHGQPIDRIASDFDSADRGSNRLVGTRRC